MARESFTESVEVFLKAAEAWLSEEDEPMATALLLTAQALDKRMSGPLLAQFGLTFRYLAKQRPQADGGVDPLEALLAGES